ncbi:MAG: hypothetical protein LQ342_007680 [Letrouitia transgressa]|nr:MAG: hypothetical protein LQ342_007680 [Letrouitia transgressa]
MGRIPGFSDAIFPKEASPNLSLVANLGLVLFLFLVGVEVDMRLLLSNWRIALSVGAAGMALPFGLGCAIAYGLYHQFRTDPGLVHIEFGTYMLFVGVAMAITAFPVLCRILTELKLLQTQVGIVTLSAGVGNDVVGWILLALCVALVNAGSGITALYILLTCVAYILVLVYIVRPAFLSILRRTGSLYSGPTQSVVALTILMTLASAFFTQIIGVHAIFGGFLIGLMCPHDGGFAIKLTEKIEDIVAVFFLPLYFALSGLNTDIGLLNDGITWGYVFGVIAIAFVGKFVGGTLAARLCKLVWRESFTIGVMMSCKGLVELIVLNIGYQAKILSQRTFTIFVVMALVTTFATTPLVSVLYPPWYQKKIAAWKRGEIDWDGNSLVDDCSTTDQDDTVLRKANTDEIRRLFVSLGLDTLPSIFTFMSLLGGGKSTISKTHPRNGDKTSEATGLEPSPKRPLAVHGVRMLELSERLSSVMKESEIDDYTSKDPVINAFRTFGQLNNVAVSGDVEIVPEGAYAEILARSAAEHSSDMVLIPLSQTGHLLESENSLPHSPGREAFQNKTYSTFLGPFLSKTSCNTALFVNNGFGAPSAGTDTTPRRIISRSSLRSQGQTLAPIVNRSHHIFFPFFGGPDDHLALRLVLRLTQSTNVTATIVHINLKKDATPNREIVSASQQTGAKDGVNVSVSPSQDTLIEQERAFFMSMKDSVPSELQPRVLFETFDGGASLQNIVEKAKSEVGQSAKNAGDLIVLGRGSGVRREFKSELANLISSTNLLGYSESDLGQCLGDVAEALIVTQVNASLLVIQARQGDST